jgi:hypothetical protein
MLNYWRKFNIFMKKYSNIISLALSIGIVVGIIDRAIADNPNEKNELPCLEEICLGDDIQGIKNVSWVSVDKLLGSKQNQGWKVIGDQKAFQSLLPYLSGRVIDQKGIKLLSQIKGFCKTPYVDNTFFSALYNGKDDKPITISFMLVASPDNKSQTIIVSNISKRISTTEISSSQRNLLGAELDKRYPISRSGTLRSKANVGLGFGGNINDTSVYLNLSLGAFTLSGAKSQQLLEFPGCTKKVEL